MSGVMSGRIPETSQFEIERWVSGTSVEGEGPYGHAHPQRVAYKASVKRKVKAEEGLLRNGE